MKSVFVRWYGHVVEGKVSGDGCNSGVFNGMVPVMIEIPGADGKAIVPGVRNICMFRAGSVYSSMDEAMKTGCVPVKTVKEPCDQITGHSEDVKPDGWQRLQEFKLAHWDQERGHLEIDALDEFYSLWRDMSRPAEKSAVAVAKPEKKLIVSDEKMEELRTELKKTLRPVRGVQLSLFD